MNLAEAYMGCAGLVGGGGEGSKNGASHGLMARDGSGAMFIHPGMMQPPSRVPISRDTTGSNLPDVHNVPKKPSRSFDLRRLFTFPSYGKSKRSKECVIDDQQPRYFDEDFLNERILDADLNQLVILPPHIDLNEWLASHVVSFVENINLLYGCLSEYCLASLCTTMNGPNNMKYLWLDERNRKCKYSAPQYIDYVMSYCHQCIYDESVFPTKYGNSFPLTFLATVQKICRLLFHVLAHLYQSHSSHLLSLNLADCLNTTSHHFLLFVQTFSLVEPQDLDPLRELRQRLGERVVDPSAWSGLASARASETRVLSDLPSSLAVESSVRAFAPLAGTALPSAGTSQSALGVDGEVRIGCENIEGVNVGRLGERKAVGCEEIQEGKKCEARNQTTGEANNCGVAVNQANFSREAVKQCSSSLVGCQLDNGVVSACRAVSQSTNTAMTESTCARKQITSNTETVNKIISSNTAVNQSNSREAVTQSSSDEMRAGEQCYKHFPVGNQSKFNENVSNSYVYYDDVDVVKQTTCEGAMHQSSTVCCGEEKQSSGKLRIGSRENKENLKLDSIDSHCMGLTSIRLIASI